MSTPTNPALWGRMKKQARATSKGSKPGRWSAQKAALARRAYENAGGKFASTKKAPRPVVLRARNLKRQAAG